MNKCLRTLKGIAESSNALLKKMSKSCVFIGCLTFYKQKPITIRSSVKGFPEECVYAIAENTIKQKL